MPTTRMWTRYGHRRLYITADDGTALGYLDLITNQPCNVNLGRAREFYGALADWRRDHPTPPSGDQPQRVPTLAPPPPTTRPAPAPRRPSADPIGPPPDDDPPVGVTIREVPAGAAYWPIPQRRPDPVADRQPPREPGPGDSPSGAWVDLAANTPGQAAAAVAAAYRDAHPVATLFGRLFGRKTDERAWRIGAAGEVETARRLARLTRPGGGWYILHAVPIGGRGTDIDHVLIGPPGIFTINTKNHPKALVYAGPQMITVNRHPTQYAIKARAEADRAARKLSAAIGIDIPVFPVIAVVGGTAAGAHTPHGVVVVTAKKLPRWLAGQPARLTGETPGKLFAIARRSSVWQ